MIGAIECMTKDSVSQSIGQCSMSMIDTHTAITKKIKQHYCARMYQATHSSRSLISNKTKMLFRRFTCTFMAPVLFTLYKMYIGAVMVVW